MFASTAAYVLGAFGSWSVSTGSRGQPIYNGVVPPGTTTLAMRRAALFALAAFGVHQLRYLAGYGGEAGEALAHQGHGYLDAALPMLISLAAAGVLGSLLLSAMSRPAGARKSSGSRWAPCVSYAAALVAVFVVQELAEGALLAGHPGGLEGIFGHGGWLALPLAVVLGFAASVVSSGIAAVEERVAGLLVESRLLAPGRLGTAPRLDVPPLARLTLAFGFARRPPPSSGLSG
jgi:hypothetical protein